MDTTQLFSWQAGVEMADHQNPENTLPTPTNKK